MWIKVASLATVQSMSNCSTLDNILCTTTALTVRTSMQHPQKLQCLSHTLFVSSDVVETAELFAPMRAPWLGITWLGPKYPARMKNCVIDKHLFTIILANNIPGMGGSVTPSGSAMGTTMVLSSCFAAAAPVCDAFPVRSIWQGKHSKYSGGECTYTRWSPQCALFSGASCS